MCTLPAIYHITQCRELEDGEYAQLGANMVRDTCDMHCTVACSIVLISSPPRDNVQASSPLVLLEQPYMEKILGGRKEQSTDISMCFFFSLSSLGTPEPLYICSMSIFSIFLLSIHGQCKTPGISALSG